jgi:Protein of unknown function (DUF3040)
MSAGMMAVQRRAQISVALTDEERARLSDISGDLRREDPRLARSLSKPTGRKRWIPRCELALVAVSVATEIVGAVERQPIVCGLAWLGMTIGAVLILFTHGQRYRPPGKPD